MSSTDLATFLLGRIAEDEREAGRRWAWSDYDPLPKTRDTHLGHPVRVLAECEAKRRIIERAVGPVAHAGQEIERRATLCDLALPYSDHPDYREEWRP